MEKMCGVLSQDEPRYWDLFEFDSYEKCGVLVVRIDPVGNAVRKLWFIGAKRKTGRRLFLDKRNGDASTAAWEGGNEINLGCCERRESGRCRAVFLRRVGAGLRMGCHLS